MENMHSSLNRCLFLLHVSINSIFVLKKGIIRIFFYKHDNSFFMGIVIFTKILIYLLVTGYDEAVGIQFVDQLMFT